MYHIYIYKYSKGSITNSRSHKLLELAELGYYIISFVITWQNS